LASNAASTELTIANEYQRKAGRRAACLMIVVVIVICIVLLAVSRLLQLLSLHIPELVLQVLS